MENDKQLVGRITHYFNKLSVAVVELNAPLRVGDSISIEGPSTGVVQQTVDSMQIEHEKIEEAKPGQSVGLKTVERVHENDAVYKA